MSTTVAPYANRVRVCHWLAEVAQGIGIVVASVMWTEVEVRLQVCSRDELDELADRLGLPAESRVYGGVADPLMDRAGVWADVNVRVFGPAS